MKLLALNIIAGLLLIAPSFAWAESSRFSGFELFAGIKLDGVTIGATFSGWTDAPTQEIWVPFSHSTGGFVSGSINYSGSPGFGRSVRIFGGRWSWLEADDHTIHSGPVLSGIVKWPPNGQTDLGNMFGVNCGDGVATFEANVRDTSSQTSGTISGCLNDQLTFPPKIWGDINLSSAP
ncbi:MAG: hypothetical protein JOZ29_03905 [Deltaproteobacteria bacterium]|nr:hypothetical protein [Deltaproteobacteria bacterium]